MTDQPTSTPEPKPVIKRSAQDKKMERDIIAAEQLSKILPAETDLLPELAEGAYTVTELHNFAVLQQTAFSDYVIQGQAEANQKIATKQFAAADRTARATLSKLRTQGKSAFMKDPEGRQYVGLDGRQPDGLKDFIASGRRLIRSGSEPGYAERLARKGVTVAKLLDLAAKLDALEAADAAQEAAIAAAPVARAQRDASAQALRDWVAEFTMFAKGQFGDRPEILKRWGLIK